MTRTLLTSLLVATPAFAVGVIPPIPRLPEAELRPSAPTVEPDPKADPMKPDEMEDPAKVLERIQQTAEAVGDRLKDKDTGTDTRKQQDQLLKDIDTLLKPPPPMDGGGGGGGGGSDMNKSDMPPPMGGGGMGGGMPPPMGGGGGGGAGRQRPPRGSRGEGQPEQQPKQPMGAGGMSEPKPMGMGQPMPGQPMGAGQPGQPGQPAGGNPGNGGGPKPPPALPLDVPLAKEVWGQLPDKMRQEVSQYYREQYLPRYNELLKQYYTALAERERKK